MLSFHDFVGPEKNALLLFKLHPEVLATRFENIGSHFELF
jgi:hypothetical protein